MAQIAERVRLGELSEGERLPSERDLAAAMQISRPTLREAVRVLADAGVLSVLPGSAGGIFVASGYVPIDLIQAKSEMRLDEVAGVLEARRLIEPRVAQLASVRASEDDLARLQTIIDKQRELIADGQVLTVEDHFLQLDTQFHLCIARATGNATIVPLMRGLLRRLEIARDMAVHEPPVPDWVIDIHDRTLAAIRSTDQKRIEIVMDEHLATLERHWEQQTGRVLVPAIPDFLHPVAERAAASTKSPSAAQLDSE